MSAFTESESPTCRPAPGGTAGDRRADGTPHVVPVGFSYDTGRDAIDVRGHEMTATKKCRDVARAG